MGNKIYDILEPYEDELLFSWVVRMIRLYSPTEKLTYMGEHLKFLFGPDTSAYPGLYWQRGLDYFVEHCGLKNSRWFLSKKDMIDSMSILPFYFFFLDEISKQEIYKKMSSYKIYRYIYVLMGIAPIKSYFEGNLYIKFCQQCMEEQPEIYLKKEHQIPGNYMCYKHKCVLHHIQYGQNWKDIDFPAKIAEGSNISLCELSQVNYKKAISIAEMCHDIFKNGFKDNIHILKEKMMHRLKECGVISEDGKFYNLEGFIADLDVEYLYKYVSVEKDLISAVFVSPRKPNPIIYLVLIQYLFGNLENYYTYEYGEGAAISVNYMDVITETVEKRMHDLSFYTSNLPKWFANDYDIIGETKTSIIIKHLKCGTVFKRSKKIRRLRKCIMCTKNEIMSNNEDIKKVPSNEVIYYVSTSEYGQLHGKKENQIRNLCNENRIPGVIHAGKDILIPIDAPYPGDKRFKINKK